MNAAGVEVADDKETASPNSDVANSAEKGVNKGVERGTTKVIKDTMRHFNPFR
jgi:hypothetical protein